MLLEMLLPALMKFADLCEDLIPESGITFAPEPRRVPFDDPMRLLLSGEPNLCLKLLSPLYP
jgi:hypothetical protein